MPHNVNPWRYRPDGTLIQWLGPWKGPWKKKATTGHTPMLREPPFTVVSATLETCEDGEFALIIDDLIVFCQVNTQRAADAAMIVAAIKALEARASGT